MKYIENIFSVQRSRILEYRKANYRTAHPAIKTDINSVEISLNLAEIYFHYRNLTEAELKWFNGERFIEETFQNEWKDIADNYSKISEFVKKEKVKRN